MQKDKIIKISLISIILFIVGIFVVSASNNISLKCVSDYDKFLVSESDKDIIDGKYFNQNNMMILDYKILNGLTEIKDSNLKVKLGGLEKFDENMINSCVRLFYEDGGVKRFKLALNYNNFLNYNTTQDISQSTGDMYFPETFSIILYSEIEGEEIIVLERTIEIETEFNPDEVEFVLQPYDSYSDGLVSTYSFLQNDGKDELTAGIYTYSLGIGAWEDKKYSVFDYYLFDSSSPKNDVKSISVDSFSYVAKDESIPGFSIELTNSIDEVTFDGNKIVFKYERNSNKAIDLDTYVYYLYITDVNGNEHFIILNINFKQYQRVAYLPGLSTPDLGKNTYVKESSSVLKASEDGTFEVVIDTPFYRASNFEILDSNFEKLEGEYFNINAYVGKMDCSFYGLETGWYNCEIYSNKSDKPSNIYSFYYEKEPVKKETILYYGDEKITLEKDKSIDLIIEEISDWILFDSFLFIGDRQIISNPYFYLSNLYDDSKFSEDFSGALHINTKDSNKFSFSVNNIAEDNFEYILNVTSKKQSDIEVNLSVSTGNIVIPSEEGITNSLSLTHTITKDGKELDEPYFYEVYYNDEKINLSDVNIERGTDSDNFIVNYGALEGEYIIKLCLKNHEDISDSVSVLLTYENSEENSLILKILNDSEIAVPKEKGHKNKIYLEGRVIENGSQINETGDFHLLTELTGVSLSGNNLIVLDSAKVGETFDVKFTFRDKSITKTFTLVEQNDENDSGIVDEDDKPIGTEPVSSIILRGFDSDKLETKFLTFPDTSGESKTISYTCYDENGNAIQNPDLKISGSDISNGILVVPNYSNKTITIYANGLFNDREFYLDFVSNSKNILNQKVIACKPNTWECSLDFDNYQFIRNSSFSASGSFSSFFDTDTNVSLALVLYDSNNKIVKYNVDSQIVKPGETVDFKAKFLMPAEIDNITVKAFFINGTDITDSSKLYMTSKSITNSGEVY